jgi:hypothetical protein
MTRGQVSGARLRLRKSCRAIRRTATPSLAGGHRWPQLSHTPRHLLPLYLTAPRRTPPLNRKPPSSMQPRGDLSSTGYVLADPGEEYLVLQPAELADPFTVTMNPGTYTVQWYGVNSRERAVADEVTVGSRAVISFSASFAMPGPVVLHLKRSACSPITKAGPDPGGCLPIVTRGSSKRPPTSRNVTRDLSARTCRIRLICAPVSASGWGGVRAARGWRAAPRPWRRSRPPRRWIWARRHWRRL